MYSPKVFFIRFELNSYNFLNYNRVVYEKTDRYL